MDDLLSGMTKADLIEESSTRSALYGDPEDVPGAVLDTDRAKAASAVVFLRESQDDLRRRDLAQWRVNELRRRGFTNVKLTLINGRADHYVSPTASPDTTPQVNKAATLCRRTTALIFTDPPAPQCVPWSGEDQDVEASITANRVLENLQSPTQLDTPGKCRRAFDRGHNTGSGFVFYTVDPKGGGRVPVVVEASPLAHTYEEATVDPMTGAPWDGEYVERFVTEDGYLSENEEEAATQWTPGIRSKVLNARHVRLLPHDAETIEEAHGVIVTDFISWGRLKQRFPELAKLQPAARDAILAYEPENVQDLLIGQRYDHRLNQKNPDESLCCVDEVFFTECADYPKGAHVIVLGGRFIPREGGQEEWGETVNGQWETFLLPLGQVKQFSEGDDNGFGHGMMEIVGSGEEQRAAMWSFILDWYESLNSRKTFLPVNSIIKPHQLKARGRAVLPMNPGGQPFFEEIEQLPEKVNETYDRAGAEMDNASGIEQVAQGLQDSSVQSGRHAYAILQQVHAGLSELVQNTMKGYIRCCMIELQLVRAYYTTPRLLKFMGEDNEHRVKTWMGADLRNQRDVNIKPGTMTLLTPEAKADLAEKWAQLGILAPHQLREITVKSLGATLGVEDDPHLLRIRRQLARWKEGPPKVDPMAMQQYQIQVAQYQQATAGLPVGMDGQPMNPATGQALPPPAHPLSAALAEIFDPRTVDMMPDVAAIRIVEVGRLMSSTTYEKQDPAWRQGVDAEFARMQQALAPPPQPVQPVAEESQQAA